MKPIIAAPLSCLLVLLCLQSHATTLSQVYQDALKSDPTYQQANADWLAAKQNLNIARAGYLPVIQLAGSYNHSKASKYSPGATSWVKSGNTGSWNTTAAGSATSSLTTHSYSITATQPIFNFSAWKDISQAQASVKAATATYLAAKQDLIQRTLSAYFTVLKDYAALRFNEASRNALYQSLLTSQEKYKVGLIAITDVYNAQASHDTTQAKQYALQAKLNTDLENLRIITGQRYTNLNGIKAQLPLITPAPANINAWVKIASKQSYTLQAQIYTTLAAKQNIAVQYGAWIPTVSGSVSYTRNNPAAYKTDDTNTTYGLSLAYTPFAGGANFANAAQARYQYLSAVALREQTYRSVMTQTRQAYLGVTAGIQTIHADQKAIESAALSLEATKAGYKVGNRTMVNILNATTNLYQQKQQYADDQYTYLNNIISLKEAAGTLGDQDVRQINQWLNQSINLPQKVQINEQTSSNITKQKPLSKPKAQNTTTKEHYSIQIYASKTLNNAKRLQQQLHNRKLLSKILFVKPWYKIISGDYASKSAATLAMHKLATLKDTHPWVIRIH